MEKIIGINRDQLQDALVELIRQTSSILPPDVLDVLEEYRDEEEPESRARRTLDSIMENLELAESGSRPICQDTGTVTFTIQHPFGIDQEEVEAICRVAVREATEKHYLRPNVVDPLTGNIKNENLGRGHPAVYFEQWKEPAVNVYLVLKGGGCENVGTQYSLPYTPLGAGRDMKGIKKVCLDAVKNAMGKGCSPGALGIGIGGDRAQSYTLSKKQLHRQLNHENRDPDLAELEEWIVEQANKLGIGPMGFGGKTTLIGAKAGAMDRVPASYFVSITYMCWAFRRRMMTVYKGEVSYE